MVNINRTIWFGNGDVYHGEIVNGKAQGRGTHRYVSGAVYEGEWEDGKIHGKGTYNSSGNVYKGEWQNVKRHGTGTFRYANGDVYEGEWEDSKMHGEGTYRYYASGNVYEGEWENDTKHGRGTMTYGGGNVYEGEWKNGKKYDSVDYSPSRQRPGTDTYENQHLGTCVICFGTPCTHIFIPCGHACACKSCSDKVMHRNRKCPICNESSTLATEVFIA